MPTRQQLEQALVNADRAGDVEAAKMLAQAISQGMYDQQVPPTAPQDPLSVEAIPTGIAGVTASKMMPQGVPFEEPQADLGMAGEVVGAHRKLRDIERGVGEAAKTFLTGATTGLAGFVGGGLHGIVEEILTGKFGEGIAERYAQAGAGALTATPETRTGQQIVGTVGGALEQLPPVIAPLLMSETIAIHNLRKLPSGTRLINDDGTPTPELREALNKKHGMVYESLSPETKASIPEFVTPNQYKSTKSQISTVAEEALKSQLKSGARDADLAGLRLDGDEIVSSKSGNAAMEQGWGAGLVRMVQTANANTRAAMTKALTIHQQVMKNLSLDIRPTDVAGEEAMKRVYYIKDKLRDDRIELKRISKEDLVGLDIDKNRITNALSDSLGELKIGLVEGDGGKILPDFRSSIIEKNAPARKSITDMVDLVTGRARGNASSYHDLKLQLDDMIDYKKKGKEGLSAKAESALSKVRGAVNESIRDVSPKYAEVNDRLADGISAIKGVQKAIGATIDLESKSVDKAVGTKLRGVMSNIASRGNLLDALDALDETAVKLGGQFDVNYKDVAKFSRLIEDRLGIVAPTSFAGETATGTARGTMAARGVDIMTGQESLGRVAVDTAKDIAGKAENKLKGVSDFNAYQTMYKVLSGRDE